MEPLFKHKIAIGMEICQWCGVSKLFQWHEYTDVQCMCTNACVYMCVQKAGLLQSIPVYMYIYWLKSKKNLTFASRVSVLFSSSEYTRLKRQCLLIMATIVFEKRICRYMKYIKNKKMHEKVAFMRQSSSCRNLQVNLIFFVWMEVANTCIM